MKHIVVIGGGGAGMMAAIAAAQGGASVTLLERNQRLGKKLAITGKGRCNITNAVTVEEIIAKIPGNGRFLFSAMKAFDNYAVIDFFESQGLKTKVERGGRVFPASDKAMDVVRTLEKAMKSAGVRVAYEERAGELVIEEGVLRGVRCHSGKVYAADSVIVATGGVTYPLTGSTGDGHRLASQAGHTITPLRPSLVPLETEEPWVTAMQGLSLKNVELTAVAKEGKKLGGGFGEMLFTHFGVSGPLILSLSKHVTDYWEKEKNGTPVKLIIDLKPALTPEQLDQRLQRDLAHYARKQFKNSLGDLLPKSMIPVIIKLSGIPEDKYVHQITKMERLRLGELIKGLSCHVVRARPIEEAIVTAGGVSIKEINPKTMESKVLPGLYFCGEVMDVDGYTGGYNLQAAWSSGYVAGRAAAANEGGQQDG